MKPLKTWLCVYADEYICGSCRVAPSWTGFSVKHSSAHGDKKQDADTWIQITVAVIKKVKLWNHTLFGASIFTDTTGQGILPCWLNLCSKLCSVVRDILTLIFRSRAEQLFVKRLTAESAACTVQPEKDLNGYPFGGLFKFLFICHFTIF